MPILTKDFESLTDDLQEIFNETAKTKIADSVGMDIWNTRDTDRLTFDHLILHGLTGAQRVTEGQDFPRITSDEGDEVTWTQKYFGVEIAITKKLRRFDLHDQIRSVVRSTVDATFDDIDQALADILLNGWDTSYTDVYGESVSGTGPDGLALFSTAHTNGVSTSSRIFRNRIKNSADTEDPALSRDAIVQARIDARTHKDPVGKTRPIRLDTLVVSPQKEDLAMRLVHSDKLPGGPDNDTNRALNGAVNIKVWDRLQTRSDSTDTSNYWFMYDSSKVKESLHALFAERPSLDAPEEVYSNKNWDYTLDFFWARGLGYPAYVWGSRGTT